MIRIRWTADRDGVAHAHNAKGTQTACGVKAIGEQFAWPTQRRCPDCMAIAEPTSATSEATLFHGYRNTEVPTN